MALTTDIAKRPAPRALLSTFAILMAILFMSACSQANQSTAESDTATHITQDSPAADSTQRTTESTAKSAAVSDPGAHTESAISPATVATTAPLTEPPQDRPTPIPIPAPTGAIQPTLADTPTGIATQINQTLDVLLADTAATSDTAPTVDTAAIADTPAAADTAGNPSTLVHSAEAHLHNLAMLKLGAKPEWDTEIFATLKPEYHESVRLHLKARRALAELASGYDAADFIPAWRIISPAPAEELLGHYKNAEAQTGIEWEYLAAINLIETGMGRIVGLSSAGAKGPMQFMPTTWEEHGIGAGDINSPADAIPAAARYLVRRGGPGDMDKALWGYNNHDAYVEAVKAYAEILRQDESQYHVIHGWEIYFATQQGLIWLPVGFESPEVISVTEFLTENPWSRAR